MRAAPSAWINFAGRDEIVYSYHSVPKRGTFIPALIKIEILRSILLGKGNGALKNGEPDPWTSGQPSCVAGVPVWLSKIVTYS